MVIREYKQKVAVARIIGSNEVNLVELPGEDNRVLLKEKPQEDPTTSLMKLISDVGQFNQKEYTAAKAVLLPGEEYIETFIICQRVEE